jgi:hypothetical protein
MASDQTKRSNYISRVQQGVDNLLTAISQLEALTLEGQALGYVQAADGPPGSLADADFVGANSFLTAAQFADVMATLGTLDAALHADSAAILQHLFQMRH